jgi:hypothetical protein
VEASHCCSAMGIGPVLRLLGLTTNYGSRASYRHCAVGTHYPEYRKTPPIRVWEMDLVLMTESLEVNSNTLQSTFVINILSFDHVWNGMCLSSCL